MCPLFRWPYHEPPKCRFWPKWQVNTELLCFHLARNGVSPRRWSRWQLWTLHGNVMTFRFCWCPGCDKMPDMEIPTDPWPIMTSQSKSSHSTLGRGATRSDPGHDKPAANNGLKFRFASSQRNTCEYNKRTRCRQRQRQRQKSSSTRFLSPCILCALLTCNSPLFFIHIVDGCIWQRKCPGIWAFSETSNKIERYPGHSQHCSLNKQLECVTALRQSICQLDRFLMRRYHVCHPSPSSTYSEVFPEGRSILSASNESHSGHSSPVQISKSYDVVSGGYSRFFFYDNLDVPQLATSSSLAFSPCGKFEFLGPFCDNLLHYSSLTT